MLKKGIRIKGQRKQNVPVVMEAVNKIGVFVNRFPVQKIILCFGKRKPCVPKEQQWPMRTKAKGKGKKQGPSNPGEASHENPNPASSIK